MEISHAYSKRRFIPYQGSGSSAKPTPDDLIVPFTRQCSLKSTSSKPSTKAPLRKPARYASTKIEYSRSNLSDDRLLLLARALYISNPQMALGSSTAFALFYMDPSLNGWELQAQDSSLSVDDLATSLTRQCSLNEPKSGFHFLLEKLLSGMKTFRHPLMDDPHIVITLVDEYLEQLSIRIKSSLVAVHRSCIERDLDECTRHTIRVSNLTYNEVELTRWKDSFISTHGIGSRQKTKIKDPLGNK